MKTMEQFWSEITASKELAEKLTSVSSEQELEALLKENDVNGTAEAFKAFVKEKERTCRELSDEELENASGGKVVEMHQLGKEGFYEVFDEGVDATRIKSPAEWCQARYLYYCPKCKKQYRINRARFKDHEFLFQYCFGVPGSDDFYCPACSPKQKLIYKCGEGDMV